MKNLLLFSIVLTFSLVSISSCKQKADKTGPEYTSAYVCPMHCEGSGSDQPGKCPVCKMDYERNADVKSNMPEAEGHNHEGHNHDGHDHGSHEGHDHEGHEH